jgi:peptidoglycan hydrolase-like protein with peptidoglycan-binding domain
VYGTATVQAVMAFQRTNEYPITGYADAHLQAFLFNGKPLNAQGQKTQVKTLPMLEGINVTSGDKGLLVRTIQSQLVAKGYLKSVTGTYDNATVKAVKEFQREHDLDADGEVGNLTWAELLGV